MFKSKRVENFIALTLFVVFLAVSWWSLRRFERNNIYFPYPEIEVTPTALRIAYEEINFKSDDGVTLNGWFVPARQGTKKLGTVLFCHGNAGNISHRLDKIGIFHSLGLDVFIFDYRGYGKSKGRPSEKGTYRDALAAYKHLAGERGIDPQKIILYGESLGGTIAIHLATQVKAGALISESAFTSVVAMGKEIFPYLPVKLMVSFHYDALSKISRVNIPVLIIHSKNDEIVPFRHAEALFQQAHAPKELYVIPGSHNDGFLAAGKDYSTRLNAFLTQYLLPGREK